MNRYRLRAGLLAAAALAGIACLVQPAFTSNGCPNSFTGSFSIGAGSSFTITFLGATYDSTTNRTTVCYELDATPDNETLSHFVIELCPELRAALVPSNDYEAVNPDPTTGVRGVKFPKTGDDVGEGTYCFTVTGSWALGCTTVTLKKGSGPSFPTGAIQGLACTPVQPPTLTCPPDITATCACASGKVVTFATPTPSSGTPPYSEVVCRDQNNNLVQSGDLFPVGTTTVTCTVTDSAGQTASCSFKITVVQDTTRPTITCPPNVTVECGDDTSPGATGTATATDNCDPSPQITYSDKVTPGNCVNKVVRTITRTWTATDACGNRRSCAQTITVRDTTPPRITCPTLDPVSGGPHCQAAIPDLCAAVLATATDNCSSPGDLICTQEPKAGTLVGAGDHTITVKVRDACGNEATCTTTLTVTCDDLKILCPVKHKIEVCSDKGADSKAGDCGAVVTYGAPTVIGGKAPIDVQCTPPSGSFFPVGTTRVTCVATDANGARAKCTFDVIVKDCEAPICKAPAPYTVTADAYCKYRLVDLCPHVILKDNCGTKSVSCVQTPPPGTILGEGTHTITFTVTDAAGNRATCETKVKVECPRPLTVICPVEHRIEVCSDEGEDRKAGDGGAVVSFGEPIVTGGKEPVTVSCSPPSGSFFPVGKTKVTCIAMDARGVKSLCSFYVVVKDCEAPVCDAGPPIKVTGDASCRARVPDLCARATKWDNATPPGSLICIQHPKAGTLVGEGTHTITLTVMDREGNSSTCTTTLEVECPTPLAITCPVPDTIEVACHEGDDQKAGDGGAVVSFGEPTVTGGIGTVRVTCTPKSGSFFRVGTTKVTCTATDSSGARVTCFFYVVVKDTEAPLCQAPAPMTVKGDAYCRAKLPDLRARVRKADNCTPAQSLICTQHPLPGTILGEGTHTITFTVTDTAGNSTTCETTFTVECGQVKQKR